MKLSLNIEAPNTLQSELWIPGLDNVDTVPMDLEAMEAAFPGATLAACDFRFPASS